MKVKKSGRELAILLEEDEEVISSLVKACSSEGITSGTILSCVGALKRSRLILRKGLEKTITQHLEVVGNGNISQHNGKPFVHLHLAAGSETGSWVGHLIEGVVDVFCEVIIMENDISMVREYDEILLERGVTVPYKLKFG
ncbi:MAG: DNA-binding protein [Candidatus Methanomethyliales bacterium]|nr:DNA-binding protein [Candidatus Methanomethylicales archaeon]